MMPKALRVQGDDTAGCVGCAERNPQPQLDRGALQSVVPVVNESVTLYLGMHSPMTSLSQSLSILCCSRLCQSSWCSQYLFAWS